jgi:hypothetical protein
MFEEVSDGNCLLVVNLMFGSFTYVHAALQPMAHDLV